MRIYKNNNTNETIGIGNELVLSTNRVDKYNNIIFEGDIIKTGKRKARVCWFVGLDAFALVYKNKDIVDLDCFTSSNLEIIKER